MYTLKITFPDGREVIDQVDRVLDIVGKYDLASKDNLGFKVEEVALGDYLPE